MPRPFSPATAEQLVAVVEAVFVSGKPAAKKTVADFADLSVDQAEAALKLAQDIGFLSASGSSFSVASPLCRFCATANDMEKAAVVRVLLESYEPFLLFRDRLGVTSVSEAAQQTKALMDLDAHREDIKDTLISLGTYTQALITAGGAQYRREPATFENVLALLASGCADLSAADARIQEQLGKDAAGFVARDEVLAPLARALRRAGEGDARGAVVEAGNAVESYLVALAATQTINVSGAHGINAKLARFEQATAMPAKLLAVGRHLGNIRNAADHGTDPEVQATWVIRGNTGIEYVYVACTFIATTYSRHRGQPPEI